MAKRTARRDCSPSSGCGPGPRSQHSWVVGQGLPAWPFRHLWDAPVFAERTSVGLDVHARSVAAAAIDGVTGELLQTRLTPAHDHVLDWVRSLPGSVAVTYEAGPTGFGLYRALTTASVRCQVAAPIKLQRPSGDRVKTDSRDAVHLARLLRLGGITSVSVPSVDQEAARDLVRGREDCRSDLMRARHRLSKLLLRHGIVYYGGHAWTTRHDAWLRQQFLEPAAARLAFDAAARPRSGEFRRCGRQPVPAVQT
jgi:transposase